jgi:hypothetical protein
MIISLAILYKILTQANSSKPQPVYHKTWKHEVEGYPASSYAKSLQTVIH